MSNEKDYDNKNNELKLEIHGLINFDKDVREKFLKLRHAIRKTVNSEEFKNKCIRYTYTNTTYTGRWWWRKANSTTVYGMKKPNGKRQEQIHELFMSGRDQFNTVADKDIDLYVTLYYSRKNVIGYTYPNTFKTWINKKFFLHRLNSKSGKAGIIGNIIHEYMHNVGFGHSFKNNSTRQHTVPYAYGYIAAEVAMKYL